jgi:hypothetical protein
MRTTADLIQELDEEAGNFTGVALVVGFEATTTFVFAGKPNRLEKLNDAVSAGGEPVALIGYDLHHGLLTAQARALMEHAGEEWLGPYLEALCAEFKRQILATGGARELNMPEQ